LRRAVPDASDFTLRSHRPGDIGWVISRHGALYSKEFGWSDQFEALVAQIGGRFLAQFDPRRERCWIAERLAGETADRRVGAVFLVQARQHGSDALIEGVAQLRLLLIEPNARGIGLGKRLVNECEKFARSVDYRSIRLWTQSMLLPARAIYQRAGYKLIAAEPHHSFGADLVGETWQLDL
jgi:GNAT superfamily N-acetyltransferase